MPPLHEIGNERIHIHTSDRSSFRRCRRKWDLGSPIRRALAPKGEPSPHLWFGSAFHAALEDYHGFNDCGTPLEAFKRYYHSTKDSEKPSGHQEMLELAEGMFIHYGNWLPRRDTYKTVWVEPWDDSTHIIHEMDEDGNMQEVEVYNQRRDDRGLVPLVEYTFSIPLDEYGLEGVDYVGTFDRVVVDNYGRYWILDYKTAKRFDTSKLEMDPQVSAYCIMAEREFGVPIEGMVFMQFMKAFPRPPRILKSGEFSVAKDQNTTYDLYRKALNEAGKPVTQSYTDYLSFLASQETADGDKFIRMDLVRRNQAQKDSGWEQILMEVRDMVNPELSIYPNPTRDCPWDCSFKALCVAMDDGSDWESFMAEAFVDRNLNRTSSRSRSELMENVDNEQ